MCRLGVVTHVVKVDVLPAYGDRVIYVIALACGCLVREDHVRGDVEPEAGSIDLCFAKHAGEVVPANS